jgi:hypothetical protein
MTLPSFRQFAIAAIAFPASPDGSVWFAAASALAWSMGVALGSMAMQASRSKQLSTSGALPLILTPGQ